MATFTFLPEVDLANNKVIFHIYKATAPFTDVTYPVSNGLTSQQVQDYGNNLCLQYEADLAAVSLAAVDAAAEAAEVAAAATALAADLPTEPVTPDSQDITDALLASAKAAILAQAVAQNVNPYSLVDSFQSKYDAASISIDLSTIVFEDYLATVTLNVFMDLNGNGTADNGDDIIPLEPGIALRVMPSGGGSYVDYPVTSNSFSQDMPTGAYIFELIVPDGYEVTALSPNPTAPVNLTAGTNDLGDAGVYETPAVPGTTGNFTLRLVIDSNGNGTIDGNDLSDPLPNGCLVRLFKVADGTHVDYTPDGNGNVDMNNIDAGEYLYGIIVPDGYFVTAKPPAASITLSADQNLDAGSFGVYQFDLGAGSGGVAVHVFTDTDGDAAQGGGEADGFSPMFAIWTGDNGGLVMLLDGSGNYDSGRTLPIGDYDFNMVLPAAYAATNGNALTLPYSTSILDQETPTNLGDWGVTAS